MESFIRVFDEELRRERWLAKSFIGMIEKTMDSMRERVLFELTTFAGDKIFAENKEVVFFYAEVTGKKAIPRCEECQHNNDCKFQRNGTEHLCKYEG